MAAEAATIHASAVLVGHKAVLIRGPAGSGKSQLVWDLLQAAAMGALPFARLVADDRAHVEHHFGRLLVRPAPTLAGMIEIRGLGIRRLDHEPLAAVALDQEAGKTVIGGVSLPRLAVAAGMTPLPMILAFLQAPRTGN